MFNLSIHVERLAPCSTHLNVAPAAFCRFKVHLSSVTLPPSRTGLAKTSGQLVRSHSIARCLLAPVHPALSSRNVTAGVTRLSTQKSKCARAARVGPGQRVGGTH